MISQI